jgi:hypothetical protein
MRQPACTVVSLGSLSSSSQSLLASARKRYVKVSGSQNLVLSGSIREHVYQLSVVIRRSSTTRLGYLQCVVKLLQNAMKLSRVAGDVLTQALARSAFTRSGEQKLLPPDSMSSRK